MEYHGEHDSRNENIHMPRLRKCKQCQKGNQALRECPLSLEGRWHLSGSQTQAGVCRSRESHCPTGWLGALQLTRSRVHLRQCTTDGYSPDSDPYSETAGSSTIVTNFRFFSRSNCTQPIENSYGTALKIVEQNMRCPNDIELALLADDDNLSSFSPPSHDTSIYT